MKSAMTHLKNFIYWLKKIMTEPLRLEGCTHSIKPQDIVSAVLVLKKNGHNELLVTTTTSRLPHRVPATAPNIKLISSYCAIYESSDENDEEFIEIQASEINKDQRQSNRKKLGMT